MIVCTCSCTLEGNVIIIMREIHVGEGGGGEREEEIEKMGWKEMGWEGIGGKRGRRWGERLL